MNVQDVVDHRGLRSPVVHGASFSWAAAVRVAFVLATAAIAAALLASSASAAITVCGPGSGAGQCSDPNGVATDFETNRLYVADGGNNRIDVFEVEGSAVVFKFAFGWGVDTGANALETCTTASGCQAGKAGGGLGQLSGPRRIAVDNNPGSEGHHDIYVYEPGNQRLQKFKPDGTAAGQLAGFVDFENLVAVGPGGTVYVSDMLEFEEEPRIKRLNPKLEVLGECEPAREDRLNIGLAVDSAGDIFAGFNKGGGILKFEWAEPGCGEVKTPPFPLDPAVETTSLAIDAADNLYAGQRISKLEIGSFRVITKYGPTGNVIRRYGYGELAAPTPGVAPLATATGDVFAAEQGNSGTVKYLSEPDPGPLVADLSATPGNIRATLKAEINPEGKASEYRFEYVDQEGYEEQGESFAGPNTKSAEGTLDAGAADFNLHFAEDVVGCEDPETEIAQCLEPETTYRYRVSATNADGEGNGSLEGSFETKEPIEVEDAFASEVGPDSARLSATLDPLGIPASGYFELEDTATTALTRVPATGFVDFGGGEGAITKSTVAGTLTPGTTYRLRFKATNLLLKGAELTAAAEPLFSTPHAEEAEICAENQAFRTGPGAYLSDCRAYELVSPLDKEGGDIVSLGEAFFNLPAVLNQSSVSGGKLAYGSYRAFGDAEAAPWTSQYIAARGATGWSSHFILGPREELNVEPVSSTESELKALSPDLCQAWFKAVAEPPLSSKAIEGEANLYRRFDRECGEESYEAVTTVAPISGALSKAELQGTSADGAEAIYAVRAKLGADAPDLKGEAFSLYYQGEGEGPPRYVCRGTDGVPIASSCSTGGPLVGFNAQGRSPSLHNAISADGERVFFSATSGVETKIFMREHPGEPQSTVTSGVCTQPTRACTIVVSAEAEGIEGTSSSQYWWAADDGSRAIFTTGDTLYEFETETETTNPIAEGAIGVMGASEDAERVYFSSTQALPSGTNPLGEAPQAGKPNLYLAEGGGVSFVATLAASDVAGISEYAVITPQPQKRTARVSPDGLHAAFTSFGSPTHYDNTDAKSGEADMEVFLYDAAGEGELICASCNPSGGRPIGAPLPKLAAGKEIWAAAQLPVWFKALYPGRVLSDDGTRLYFEATDALVPRDSNGAVDVYQWEAPGAGGREQSDPDYSTQNQGCVSLISSGQSAGDARFLDASPNGNDVFFTTAASLLDWDYGLVDIYDARVGGGLPAPPVPPAECEGEACQSPAAAPEPPRPSSLTYTGPGNQSEGAKKPRCAKGKVRRRVRGKSRCVKPKAQRAKRRAQKATKGRTGR